MQKTTNLQLNSWLPDDPVILDEVNENFSVLDAEAGRTNDGFSANASAHEIMAYHLTRRALESFHAGSLTGRARNLMLADYSKPGQYAELVHLELSGNKPVAAAEGLSSFQTPFLIPESEYTLICPLHLNSYTEIAHFVAEKNGQVTSVSFHFNNGASDMFLDIREDGQSVAQTEEFDISNNDVTLAVSFPLTAGKSYAVYASVRHEPGTVSGLYLSDSGGITVSGTGLTYESGYILSKTQKADRAGTMYLYACYGGTAPQISLSADGGEFLPLQQLWQEDTDDLSGQAAKLGLFLLAGVPAKTLQLKLLLPDLSAELREFAAIVL